MIFLLQSTLYYKVKAKKIPASLVLHSASSTEFMGEFWLRKLAKCVI